MRERERERKCMPTRYKPSTSHPSIHPSIYSNICHQTLSSFAHSFQASPTKPTIQPTIHPYQSRSFVPCTLWKAHSILLVVYSYRLYIVCGSPHFLSPAQAPFYPSIFWSEWNRMSESIALTSRFVCLLTTGRLDAVASWRQVRYLNKIGVDQMEWS